MVTPMMNTKAISALLVLAGVLGGYKLGQHTAPPPVPVPPSNPPVTAAVARPLAPAGRATEVTPQTKDVNLIVRRIRAGMKSSNSYQRSAAVAAAVRDLPADRVAEVFGLLRHDVNQGYGYTILYVLMPRWAEHDPAAALEYAQGLSSSRRIAGVNAALSGWARSDLEGAIAYVEALPIGLKRTAAAGAIVNAMSEQDPARALAFIQNERLSSSSSSGPIANVFSVWAETDPAVAAAELMNLPGGKQRDTALRTLAQNWAKNDPHAALAFVRNLPATSGRRQAMNAVLGEMTTTDPYGAATAALNLKGFSRLDAVATVSARWAQLDLSGALMWASSLPGTPEKNRALRGLAYQWAREDPLAAAAFAETQPLGKHRNDLISAITSTWSAHDGAAALEWINTLPPGTARKSALTKAIDNVANHDPATAAKWLAALPDESARSGLYDDIARTWARSNPAAAIAWVKTLPSSGQSKASRDIVRNIGADNAHMAAEFIASLPEKAGYDLVDDVANLWSAADPVAARVWAESLPVGKSRDRAFSSIISTMTAVDPEAAAAMALGLPEGSHKNGVITSLTTRWAAYDSEAALSWIETLPGEEQRIQAMQGLIGGIASSEPETAATYVASLPPGTAQDKAAITVMNRWASAAPRQAAQWAAQFPEGPARQNAMRTLMSSWGRRDVSAASQFLGTLPEGTSRARAIDSFVDAADSQHPARAAEWVTALEPGDRTYGKIEKVARYWMRTDHDAALEWLKQSGLPEDRLQNVINGNRPSRKSSYRGGINLPFGGTEPDELEALISR